MKDRQDSCKRNCAQHDVGNYRSATWLWSSVLLVRTRFLLLVSIMAAVRADEADCRCGVVNRREFGAKEGEERILGGGEAEVGEYPWMASKASSQSHYISLKKKIGVF